ncbi:hypothetical protein TBK1r_35990 [Stieleria magnilauensis]|uniref:Uncharacterized protein n=1 Tax=Stieleria magnilauensis TaxID=2527963 RepID=A0ABX5XRL2_9BACT|nr:hypothetical protein TBK1r_35990 [Planctomycetes bacterium TBK1r]
MIGMAAHQLNTSMLMLLVVLSGTVHSGDFGPTFHSQRSAKA